LRRRKALLGAATLAVAVGLGTAIRQRAAARPAKAVAAVPVLVTTVTARTPQGRIARRRVGLGAATLAVTLFAGWVSLPWFDANTSESVAVLAHVEGKPAGCDPEYWRDEAHRSSWDGEDEDYTQHVHYNDAFVDYFSSLPELFDPDDSLLNVLWTGGGGDIEVARHAAAQVANVSAAKNGYIPGYLLSEGDVETYYEAAINDGQTQDALEVYEAYEDDCPLGEIEDEKDTFNQDTEVKQDGEVLTFRAESTPAQTVEDEDAALLEEDDGGLTDFERWAGLGPLPPIPEECAGIDFDKVFVMWEPDRYVSAGGNDLIFGTDGDDIIDAGEGDDCIVAGGGNDEVHAGPGDDVVVGGSGDDSIHGEEGNDTLLGESGDDLLWGGDDDDSLDGGVDDDRCAGEGGTNEVVNCEPIPAPSGFSGKYASSTQSIEITWEASPDAVSYVLYRSYDAVEWHQVFETEGTSYEYAGLEPDTTYYFYIVGVDSVGFAGEPSFVISITTTSNVVTVTPEPSSTAEPDPSATAEPGGDPTQEPTGEPTEEPTGEPTGEATQEPTSEATEEATAEPSVTEEPSATAEPSSTP
jgi:hypothetical protein